MTKIDKAGKGHEPAPTLPKGGSGASGVSDFARNCEDMENTKQKIDKLVEILEEIVDDWGDPDCDQPSCEECPENCVAFRARQLLKEVTE